MTQNKLNGAGGASSNPPTIAELGLSKRAVRILQRMGLRNPDAIMKCHWTAPVWEEPAAGLAWRLNCETGCGRRTLSELAAFYRREAQARQRPSRDRRHADRSRLRLRGGR